MAGDEHRPAISTLELNILESDTSLVTLRSHEFREVDERLSAPADAVSRGLGILELRVAEGSDEKLGTDHKIHIVLDFG